jgi:signal transduction histidine kinase
MALRVRSWSVRRKLVALLILASLVPLAIDAVMDLYADRARMLGEVGRALVAHAEQLRDQLDAFHQRHLDAARMLARTPEIGERARLPAGDARPANQILTFHVASDPDIKDAGIVDTAGTLIASTAPHMIGRRLTQPYVRAALAGTPTVSQLYVADDALDDSPLVGYATPIADHAGAVVVWVHAEAIWRLAAASNDLAGPGSYAIVLDHDGIRIAHTRAPELVFHPTGPLAAARLAELTAERRFGADTAGLLADVRSFGRAYAVAREASPDVKPFREPTVNHHDPNHGVVRRLKGVDWTVVYLMPVDALDQQIAVVTRNQLIFVGLIMLGALAIGAALAAIILRPIASLADATARIAGGDLSARVPPADGGDEVARLCASFNAMVDRVEHDAAELRRSRGELEDRVAERTAELVRAAITEARSRGELEASARRLELLSRTSHELASASGELDAVLELSVRRLGEAIGDCCVIRLISDDGAWLEPTRAVYHVDATLQGLVREVMGSARAPVGDRASVSGEVAARGEAQLLPEVALDRMLADVPAAFHDVFEQLGVTSLIAVPLRSRERTIGVVTVMRGRASEPYTVDDQRFAQDVADRAGLAIDNAVLVDTLERRVAARTAALETANHELEAFSYSVSHDLRAPLRTIDGFSDILVADYGAQLDAEAQRLLQRIRVATQKMAGLIDDLLDLARISRVQLRWNPIDLTAIASQITGELARRDPARTTPVHLTPGLVSHGDARLITIALENLLGNAWKFTARTPGAEIWLGTEPRDGRDVCFVRDTGAGFDMKYADKLFLPFQRLHSADEFEGVGVGLATVQRIIAHHGGRIWAEAEVGHGATFYFFLGEPAS